MKKSIISVAILLAMMLSSCADNTGGGAAVDGTGTTGVNAATTESVVESSVVTTETETSDAETEFDINAEENLPFRLLHMTFEEIEAEFGPYVTNEGRYFTDLQPLGIKVVFEEEVSETIEIDESVIPEPDSLPFQIQLNSEFEDTLYPGFKLLNGTAMTAEEAYTIFSDYTDSEWDIVNCNPLQAPNYEVHIDIEGKYDMWLNLHYSMDLYSEFNQEFMSVPEELRTEWLETRKSEFCQMLEQEKTGSIARARIRLK